MVAKAASPKKSKTATPLKSPKTPKGDKVAKNASKIQNKVQGAVSTTTKDELLKTGLNAALVQKATEALIKYHESKNADKLSLLGTDQPIQVQFTLLRTPESPSRKPIRIMIPHPLFQLKSSGNDDDDEGATGTLEEPEVCLIVKEESKPWCQEMIERFPEHMGCVKKVLGLQSLRTKHARYDQRRTLLHKYNVFMADDRILPMLSKALGKDFYKAKKLPIPISLTRKEALPFAIQKALSATYMSISTGTCIMVRAGNTSMTPQQLTENIVAIADGAVPNMPQKWANVQNIAIKTPESVALPIYSRTPEVLKEIAAKAGVVQKVADKEIDSAAATKATKKNEKKRETTSPLLQALKKQKQEENTKKTKDEKAQEAVETPKQKKQRSLSEDSSSRKAESAKQSPKKAKADKQKESEVTTPTVKKSEEKGENDKKAKKAKESDEAEQKKDFIAAKKFNGSKKGYVFRMGKEGLGYYVDVKPKVDQMAMDALVRAAKAKGNRGAQQKKNKYKGNRKF